jgi:tetratricopeptide (TPR) repeat protein
LSRNMLSIQQQGALASYPQWQEMYAYAKEISERHLKDHPRNTHPLFVYARLVHGMIPIQPEETRAEEAALAEELYLRAIETSPKRQQIAFGLARLYSETGRSEQGYETLKRVVSYNENVGEAWWYLGLVSWFELGKEDEGTADLIRAVDAKAPYALQNAQDAWRLAQAALIREDLETLKGILPVLPSLGGGSMDLYLQIARIMEQAGLLEQRNSILNALLRIDETLAPKLEGLRTGAVNTIDESFMLVADQVPGEENASENAPADPDTNVLSSEPGSQTSTQPASEPGGAGPRR